MGLGLVPGRAQQWLWRAAGALAGKAEAKRRFKGIRWADTKAYSEELGYHPSVRLNVKGRDPQGCLAASEVPAFTEQLVARLEDLKDPWTGGRVVKKAWRREELYQGPAVEEAPELILELALDSGYTYNLLSSGAPGPTWRRLSSRERLGSKGAGMNGTHRRDGFWLVHGPRVSPRRKRAEVMDIAPTALAALERIPPTWMEGRSHIKAGDNAAHVPSRTHSSEREETTNARAYTPAQQAVVEERLRQLGYL